MLRYETTILENQFGFMPALSTVEVIFVLRCIMEKYREACEDLHFINLEKAYDRVPREVCGGQRKKNEFL